MDKYGFIYLWYDRKRKMYYVGSHWGTVNDGYICSSNRMRDAYRRRPDDFKRRIIQTNVSHENLLDEEHKWLSKIPDSELGKKYYNLKKHKWGHWSTDDDKRLIIGHKISEKNKGRKAWNKGKTMSEETKEKLRQKAIMQFSNPENRKKAGKVNLGNKYTLGKKHSEETKEKIRNKRKLQKIYFSEDRNIKIGNSLRGRTLSEEHKEKIRQSLLNNC